MITFYSAAKTITSKIFTLAFALFTLIAISNNAAAQYSDEAPKNTFFAEFSGTPSHYSVNYMRTFRTGDVMNYSYSIGYGMQGKDFFVPVSINAFTTGESHHFIAGVTVAPYVAHHQKIKRMDLDKQLFVTPNIGYMFQQQSGLFIKATINSQIQIDPPARNFWAMSVNVIKPTASVSVGFSF